MNEPIPWLCAGDFNEILYHHEKEGGYRGLKLVWTDSRAFWRCVIFMIWASLVMCSLGKINKQKGAHIYGRG
jgi:hypothetical protein